MTTTTDATTTVLEFRWSTSRAAASYGYNACTLWADGRKVARHVGGGYDMEGSCLGDFIARHYAERLRELTAEQMPAQRHWERARELRRFCCDPACWFDGPDEHNSDALPADALTCPNCGGPTRPDYNDGTTVDDGRYFPGLTFHDPNYDPSTAVIGRDCHDRCLSNEDQAGRTVAEAEAAGVSLGLERYQAFYNASSHVPTARHRVPLLDGAYGKDAMLTVARAIGLELSYKARHGSNTIYELIDRRS